jgi:bifunctional oligoribonuclease and PAP phosphatase NrnA
MRALLSRTAEAILRANKVVIASHVNPDGDTIGCNLALTHALRALGKSVTSLSSNGVPQIYRWMPGQERILTETNERGFDLAIVVDTGTLDRVGRAREAVESAASALCIDHHPDEGRFGNIRFVDSDAAATGELVYRVIRRLGMAITPDIATCLMCAIVTDTGAFRFMNVKARTLRISAELMRYGAVPADIAELVFESRSVAALKLLGRSLDRLTLTPDGRAAYSALRAADFREMGATDEDTEGIVNHVRAVRGTQVGILFREIEGNQVRVSLRSRVGFDVNRVAGAFGGGGHRLASGCTLDQPTDEAVRAVLAEVARCMA